MNGLYIDSQRNSKEIDLYVYVDKKEQFSKEFPEPLKIIHKSYSKENTIIPVWSKNRWNKNLFNNFRCLKYKKLSGGDKL